MTERWEPIRANNLKLRIHGAAGEVTGSNYMIETGSYKVLVDCGFHQGQDEEKHEGESFHLTLLQSMRCFSLTLTSTTAEGSRCS